MSSGGASGSPSAALASAAAPQSGAAPTSSANAPAAAAPAPAPAAVTDSLTISRAVSQCVQSGLFDELTSDRLVQFVRLAASATNSSLAQAQAQAQAQSSSSHGHGHSHSHSHGSHGHTSHGNHSHSHSHSHASSATAAGANTSTGSTAGASATAASNVASSGTHSSGGLSSGGGASTQASNSVTPSGAAAAAHALDRVLVNVRALAQSQSAAQATSGSGTTHGLNTLQLTVLVRFLHALVLDGTVPVDKLHSWHSELLANIDSSDAQLWRYLKPLLLELCRADSNFLAACVHCHFSSKSRNAAAILVSVDDSQAARLLAHVSDHLVSPHSRIAALLLTAQALRRPSFADRLYDSPLYPHLISILSFDCHIVALSTACMAFCMALPRITLNLERIVKDLIPTFLRLLRWQQAVLDGPQIQERQAQQFSQTVGAFSSSLSAGSVRASQAQSQPQSAAFLGSQSARASLAASTVANTPRSSAFFGSRLSGNFDLPSLHLDESMNRSSMGSTSNLATSTWIVLAHVSENEPSAEKLAADAGVQTHMRQSSTALLRLLYSTMPNSLLNALRTRYAMAAQDRALLTEFKDSLRPLLIQVGLHPSLVLGSASGDDIPAGTFHGLVAVSNSAPPSAAPQPGETLPRATALPHTSSSSIPTSAFSFPAFPDPADALASSHKSPPSSPSFGLRLSKGGVGSAPTTAAPLHSKLQEPVNRASEAVTTSQLMSLASLRASSWDILGNDAVQGAVRQEKSLWDAVFGASGTPISTSPARDEFSPDDDTLLDELDTLSFGVKPSSSSSPGAAASAVFQQISDAQTWLSNHLHQLHEASRNALPTAGLTSSGSSSSSTPQRQQRASSISTMLRRISVGAGSANNSSSPSPKTPSSPAVGALAFPPATSSTMLPIAESPVNSVPTDDAMVAPVEASSSSPATSAAAVSVLHPLPTDVQILQTQLVLARNELLYEKVARELDDHRARKLQQNAQRGSFLETEVKMLRLQIEMRGKDSVRLQQAFEKQRLEHQQTLERQTKWERDLQATLRRNLEENLALRETNVKLDDSFTALQLETTRFRHAAEQAQTQVRLLEGRLEVAQKQLATMEALRKQVETLSHETLQRDDEDDKRIAVVQVVHEQLSRVTDESLLALSMAQQEIADEQARSGALQQRLRAAEGRAATAEEKLADSEAALKGLRRDFEVARGLADSLQRSTEEKFTAVRNANIALENRVLDLYAERERLPRGMPAFASGRTSRSSSFRATSSDDASGGEQYGRSVTLSGQLQQAQAPANPPTPHVAD
ncbi:hypothetical protein CAOG_04474 [Capsaspora owczarzaki ATCC 30864]|uniref:Hamartin n=1 Tax=Capsaspora owczarzaki (strain ATCC 30864) TaxID=595528 RepID=A0A0D2VRY1_CAPO3|nr:hypothetical protein CAOG_04474 [Capsaspora owczarzaki ATCC 30864]KJE93722.1 hypothetical protein CAOG_004474 [Capsaspora owczarzaki ATCC 30864]|eukprot:XP_004348302.1 hypothetical protein CAOG_04474 [Capsaspora owczarzaki ATCC 30864]